MDLQVRVGIFIFSGLLLAMVIVFLLGGQKQLFERQYSLTATFDEISGLRVGAPVQLAGVRVGVVDQIAFAPSVGEKKVQVRLRINRDTQERIRADSTAAIETQGLLGDKLVAISHGSADQPVLEDGGILSVEERPSIFQLAEKGADVIANVNKASKALARVLEELEKGKMTDELKVASQELRSILQKINRGEGTLGALVNDPSLYYDIRRLFGKVERNRLLRSIIRSRIRDVEKESPSP